MNALIALTLLAASPGEPVLLGGPEAARVRVEQGSEYSRSYQAAYRRTVSRRGAVQGAPASDRRPQLHHAGRAEVRAGDPVSLGADFFFAPQAGGVERPAPVLVYGRRGVLVIGPAHAPVSAGQAAAARGLPRD
ncbi:MAG: hypothetical protein NXI12_06950 [Alphaproteobacteria bacterium]|nr:hypothetical protein [Alphaproteobacteria bacterium]